ncbi:TolC family protein [Myxococcaceae bacterium GXIMD 01537]
MRALLRPFILPLALCAAPAWAERTLTLEEALRTAAERQPQLRQAQSNTDSARARADQTRAGLLPQVNINANYQYSTSTSSTDSTVAVRRGGSYSVGATASQLLYDFGQTANRYRASRESAEAQADSQSQTRLNVLATAGTAYFNVLAQQALVGVASDTLENEVAHLSQVQAQVEVGSRPEIDLLQQRTAKANAQVQLIQARNAYATSKAQLNQAMGVEGPTDYAVREVEGAPVKGEDLTADALVEEALSRRPDLAATVRQIHAQELQVSATRGGFWPSVSASVSGSGAGRELMDPAFGLTGQVGLSWPIFESGRTLAAVREQQANLRGVEAQSDALRQQVRLEVEQAQLAVHAARESLSATEEALVNARARLQLAEGRYREGVGNIIELGDAQLDATSAAAQQVQAVYSLATARTELSRALGLSVL